MQNNNSRNALRAKHEKFLFDTELIDFKNVMVFSHPNDKNKFFYLGEKLGNGKNIRFFGQNKIIPISGLYTERNLFSLTVYDKENNPIKYSSNEVLEIARSEECDGFLTENSVEFLQNNFYNKTLPMLRRYELSELNKQFIACQIQEREMQAKAQQTTFNYFEK